MDNNGFRSVPDEELIVRLREGDTRVTDYLMEKYKDMVRKRARLMYLPGADTEDLIQEGMIGLFKAIRDYEAGHRAGFKSFAELCVSRQIVTAVEASCRKKHAPLNSYVSLYSAGKDGDEMLFENLSSLVDPSPEEKIIDTETVQILTNRINAALSKLEQQVFWLYLTGMDYVEIARALDRSEKSIDNALQRIKSKAQKCVREVNA